MAAAEKSFDGRLVVFEKNRLIDGILLGAIPAGLLAFLAFLVLHVGVGALGLHLAVIAAALRYGVWRQNYMARPHERTVHASAEGITSDGVLLPRSRIANGWFQPREASDRTKRKRPAGLTVQLFDRRRRMLFEAEVASEAQGIAMLRALGLDASQRRAEFRGPSPLVTSQVRGAAVTLGAIAMAGGGGYFAERLGIGTGPLFLLVALPFLLLTLAPSTIVVGVDGVLTRWLGRKRFYPMSEIVEADAEGETRIVLRLTNGKTQTIDTSSSKRRGGVYTQYRDMILARIREAQASHRERGPSADVATLVARGERTLAEWKTALGSLAEADASYRRAAIREEDLWRVVEDPRAAADARAGAARLLRSGLDDEGKARVRVAAEATASPKLRVALEAATDGSDEAVDEALEALALEKRA